MKIFERTAWRRLPLTSLVAEVGAGFKGMLMKTSVAVG
jgi:hypothetical protein